MNRHCNLYWKEEIMYKVLIAVNEMLIRMGLESLVNSDPRFHTVALAKDGEEALEKTRELLPDLILADLDEKHEKQAGSGLEFVKQVRRELPEIPVIMVAGSEESEYVQQALKLGVRDVIVKSAGEGAFRKLLDRTALELVENREADTGRAADIVPGIHYSGLVLKALYIIDRDYMEQDLSLISVADELDVTPQYLSRIIRDQTGDTFVTCLSRRRMKQAMLLLSDPGLRLYQISEKCGYATQHYFSYVFRKMTGMTPGEYRRSVQA